MRNGTSHNQASPWSSTTPLSLWRECNELHFVTGQPAQPPQFLGLTPDCAHNDPAMREVGARQHPRNRGRCSVAVGAGEAATVPVGTVQGNQVAEDPLGPPLDCCGHGRCENGPDELDPAHRDAELEAVCTQEPGDRLQVTPW